MAKTTATRAATTDAGGLRQRKKRQTRQALQQAAVQLFGERGPEAVTVDDICTRAQVSPRTFFNYFTSKEEVLVPWDPETVDTTPERIAAQPGPDLPLRAVHTVLGELIDTAMVGPTWRDQARLLRTHPELLRRVVAASRALEAALAEGLARRLGTGVDEPYVRLLSATAITAMRIAIQTWQESDSGTDLHDYLDSAFARLGRGLSPD
ncbi:TetR/AcrR family transcriptional regulator [Saccharopolyspora rosea]|uniref:TetR/AcrR family transcriptional regulator n=1 Tax=Saccharopolyspora rosea TaxID=524884 RepID=A0ABW3FY77_9PSEU|nr:TetR/AcrR family transcriptional regulator [Saccharopolyspora rosea]